MYEETCQVSNLEKKKTNAVISIQKVVKKFLVCKPYQEKYRIPHLDEGDLTLYQVYIKGNDPDISGLPFHKNPEKVFAIIGTSGLRIVDIALQMGGKPKLIIIDNSLHVIEFWRTMRELIRKADSPEDFLDAMEEFIKKDTRKYYKCENNLNYLKQFTSDKNKFKKIKRMIQNATIIGQSWADEDILTKIKNILDYNGIKIIYVYPSNIVSYLSKFINNNLDAAQVIMNIKQIKPNLAIHTDMVMVKTFNSIGFTPKHVIISSNHTTKFIIEKLNSQQNYTCSTINKDNLENCFESLSLSKETSDNENSSIISSVFA